MPRKFVRIDAPPVFLAIVLILAWSSLGFCGEIHEAVAKNNIAKVQRLIEKTPGLISSKDEDGFTPLHVAAANGHKGMLEFLLSNKAEVNSKDNAGSTPLHQVSAAKGNHTDLVGILVAHGADVNAPDKR